MNWLKALLASRKFWLAFVAFVGALVLYLQGAISPDQLVDAIVALAAILIAAIAGEDFARNLRP